MSDAPPRGPGNSPAVTVPLAAQPAHPGMSPAPGLPPTHSAQPPPYAAPMRHPATQMSPSAVPSTLESPKNDPLIIDLGAARQLASRLDVTLPSNLGSDDPSNGSTLRDDAARDAAIREAVGAADAAIASGAAAASTPSARRQAPATQMSPVKAPGQSAPPGPPATENAVVDAVLPAAAFLPPPPTATMDMSPGYGEAIQHAGWGPPGAHAGAFDGRDRWGGGQSPMTSLAPAAAAPPPTSRTLIALIVGGVVVLVLGIGIIGAGIYFFSARARAVKTRVEPTLGGGAPQTASPTASPSPPTTEGSPKALPRVNDGPRNQGGTKAKISELTASGVDVNASRNAITAALPKIDSCFVASETEPPNHENAAYDLDSAPNGVVTRVEPGGAGAHAPRLDACVVSVLRTVRLPKSAGAGKVKVTLTAPVKG